MLRLFLSVDIAGSTQFKSSMATDGAGWLAIFHAFFSHFPLMLAGEIGMAFLDEEDTPAVDVWKVMGDEVIFVAALERRTELAPLLVALLTTMRLFEERHFAALPLRLKGTAWVAAFPSPNIEIEIPELSSGGGVHVDYIGPDIDLGFRIGKFARPGTMAVSLDLAELLLDADNGAAVALTLIGREPLKGVAFARPYPIIWAGDAAEPPVFLPWEVEDCPLTARAAAAEPTPPDTLRRVIGDMRLYLRRMHGLDAIAPTLV